jgi:hypothetical protein
MPPSGELVFSAVALLGRQQDPTPDPRLGQCVIAMSRAGVFSLGEIYRQISRLTALSKNTIAARVAEGHREGRLEIVRSHESRGVSLWLLPNDGGATRADYLPLPVAKSALLSVEAKLFYAMLLRLKRTQGSPIEEHQYILGSWYHGQTGADVRSGARRAPLEREVRRYLDVLEAHGLVHRILRSSQGRTHELHVKYRTPERRTIDAWRECYRAESVQAAGSTPGGT